MVFSKDKWNDSLFLSIGTNMGDRLQNIAIAIDYLKKELGEITQISSVYETKAWGADDLFPFLNIALEIKLDKDPLEILKITQSIEKRMGRQPKKSFAYENRIIDIDLLLHSNKVLNNSDLVLPHPHMNDRKFVLIPLNELAPSLVHPLKQKPISYLLDSCLDETNVNRLNTDLEKFLKP